MSPKRDLRVLRTQPEHAPIAENDAPPVLPIQAVQATATSPEQSRQDAAWSRYHELRLSTDKPVELMNALLDTFAAQYTLQQAVRAYVQADPDSSARIMAFGAMVRAL